MGFGTWLTETLSKPIIEKDNDMTTRITQKDLETLTTRINQAANQPVRAWTKGTDGKFAANIGNYHLDYAYGGVKLVQLVNPGGGIRVISSGGYIPKRELYHQLNSFLMGLDAKE